MSAICPNSEKEWRQCTRCRLQYTRRLVVLNRWGTVHHGKYRDLPPGKLPYYRPTILFIGEAPGEQEDHSGLPFQGVSGRILHIIWEHCEEEFNYCVTNTVACRPTQLNIFDEEENRQPTKEEIDLCKPRLEQLVMEHVFDGVVYLGAVANFSTRNHISKPGIFTRALKLTHPASIAKEEYKLLSVKKQARKLNKYVATVEEVRNKSLYRG
jgi:uracil-DNA glycosylase family 4